MDKKKAKHKKIWAQVFNAILKIEMQAFKNLSPEDVPEVTVTERLELFVTLRGKEPRESPAGEAGHSCSWAATKTSLVRGHLQPILGSHMTGKGQGLGEL